MDKKIVIAIDGCSSSGKSTMAKNLAKKLGYIYVDTGAMYRAVTLYALENGMINEGVVREEALKNSLKNIRISLKKDAEGSVSAYLNEKNVEKKIRSMEVSNSVSLISRLKFVREAMVLQQQEMGKEKGIVMDGRDIGSVVFPDAELKIFLTASPEVRAKRRTNELREKGEEVSFDEVLKNLTDRDRIDSTREESPLIQAPDALLLDNSDLSREEQHEWLMNAYQKAVANDKENRD